MIEASEERVELAAFAQNMVAGNVIEAFTPDDVSGNNPDLLCALPEHLLVSNFFSRKSVLIGSIIASYMRLLYVMA